MAPGHAFGLEDAAHRRVRSKTDFGEGQAVQRAFPHSDFKHALAGGWPAARRGSGVIIRTLRGGVPAEQGVLRRPASSRRSPGVTWMASIKLSDRRPTTTLAEVSDLRITQTVVTAKQGGGSLQRLVRRSGHL